MPERDSLRRTLQPQTLIWTTLHRATVRPKGSCPLEIVDRTHLLNDEELAFPCRSRLLVTKLRRKDIDRLDRRRVREQLGCLRHEGGGDLAGEMRPPTRIVRKRVKDSECG